LIYLEAEESKSEQKVVAVDQKYTENLVVSPNQDMINAVGQDATPISNNSQSKKNTVSEFIILNSNNNRTVPQNALLIKNGSGNKFSVFLCIFVSIYLIFYLSYYLFIYLSIYLSIYLFI